MRSPKSERIARLSAVMLLAVTPWIAAPAAAASEDGEDAGLAAMARLAAMEGDWKGGGWMQRGPGEPHRFDGSERVRSMLGGRVLMIEGKHHDAGTGGLVHHALAVVSWDEREARYGFRTYLSDGRGGDFAGRFEDGNFIWGMELPGQQIRYTLTVDDERWFEIGERSGDGGETWQKFFEMDLRRVKSGG